MSNSYKFSLSHHGVSLLHGKMSRVTNGLSTSHCSISESPPCGELTVEELNKRV